MDVFTQSNVIGGDEGELRSLIAEVRAGRRAALERLVARVQLRVRAWAARFSDDEDTADDVAQEVLISLSAKVHRFDGRSRFATWLFSVTRNVALSRRRREEHRAELLAPASTAERSEESADLDAAALAALVLRYFEALPAKQRLIFELADIRGHTPAEIARELGMEAVTVRSHLFKARRAIREKMLKHHERLLKEYRS
jgi:RNA polymerase sigma-70 factor (ECF subfamily)